MVNCKTLPRGIKEDLNGKLQPIYELEDYTLF